VEGWAHVYGNSQVLRLRLKSVRQEEQGPVVVRVRVRVAGGRRAALHPWSTIKVGAHMECRQHKSACAQFLAEIKVI
jgi:hypothetical protein